MAELSGAYGDKGQWAFVPVAIGFVLGALFVFGADRAMPQLVSDRDATVPTYVGPDREAGPKSYRLPFFRIDRYRIS